MAVDDLWEVTYQGYAEGQAARNVVHWRESVADVAEPDDAMLAGTMDRWVVGIMPSLNHAYKLTTVIGRKLAPAPPGPPIFYIEPEAAGGITGDWHPTQVAVVITKRSIHAGRSRRGRLFVGPISESSTDGSILTGAIATALHAGVEAYRQPLIGPGGIRTWQAVIYSPLLGSTVLWSSHTIQPVVGTMRSRRVRFDL